MEALFAAAPTTAKTQVTNVVVTKVAPGGTQQAVSISGAIGSAKAGQSGSGLSKSVVGGSSLTASAAGSGGFKESGVTSKAGQRGVEGAVVGTPSFSGGGATNGLKNDQVMSVVNKYLSDIHRCYERALFENPNLIGRIEYEWDISASGNVTDVRVKRADMANADKLNSCVMDVFRRMKFPNAASGESTLANIGFPFGKH